MNKTDMLEMILDNSGVLVAIILIGQISMFIFLSFLLLKGRSVSSEERGGVQSGEESEGLHTYCQHFISSGG